MNGTRAGTVVGLLLHGRELHPAGLKRPMHDPPLAVTLFHNDGIVPNPEHTGPQDVTGLQLFE